MSPTHRGAETPAQPARSAHDGTPSRLVPKWARAGGARPRKIIPLRLSAAPQVAAGPSSALPAAAARVSGPDLLAQDAVFRQLLSAKSDPVAVQPVRDPVGLALGVVARLMVAACAAAALTMLLVGALPLPSWPSVAAKSAMVSPPAVETADATTRPDRGAVAPPAALVVKAPSTSGDAKTGADAAPVRVSTLSVHAQPRGGADQAALAPDEVMRLVKRGEDSLAQGDVAAARLILGRAAEAHDAQAALSVGATFDPAVLRQLHVIGFQPDIAQARAWYERAAAYGSVEAAHRLAALPRLER
ncbi:MAG TPA: hypothetical protein VLX44_11425 [Xanthobacteraceae bacterium]|nr:hypothetical protein [Xanthobacteraceae bacterium]